MATILVVEDEFGVAELLESVLADEGHTVVTAANGRQALDRLGSEAADLIMLDFMMPVMDGPAFLRALRADRSHAAVPIVVMSSMPRETVDERMDGYAAFVRKPFRIDAVVDLVARLLSAAGPR